MVRYEDIKISFTQPAKQRKYTPDFILKNGIVIETKGRFVAADRMKHLFIKEIWGNKYDIRFVFNNPNAKLYKGAKSTYGQWCDKHGFQYAKGKIPQAWFEE